MKFYKRLYIILILSGVVFSGCVPQVKTTTFWDTSITNDEVFKEDLDKCVYQANLNTQKGILSEAETTKRIRELRDMCLKSKGYKIVSKETPFSK